MEQGVIWCRFRSGNGISYGLVNGDRVTEIEGDIFGDHGVTARSYPLAAVRLEVPVIPGTFFCAGVNYRDHIVKTSQSRGKEPVFPTRPDIGYRANNALLADGDAIVKPKDAGELFQYEGELVAVIGRKAKKVSRDEAHECIFGWTIGNDVSERTWQRGDRTMWRGKNSDTFKPMGPWIVSGLDPRDMTTIIRLNGDVVERFATGNMIFDAVDYIVEMTKYVTLHPGDVMWLGTDGLPRNMKPGDTVEVEITGIGTLRNPIVAEG